MAAVLREATNRLFSDVQGVPNWHIESAVKKIPSPFSSCEFCLTDFQPVPAALASKASSHKPETCGTEAMLWNLSNTPNGKEVDHNILLAVAARRRRGRALTAGSDFFTPEKTAARASTCAHRPPAIAAAGESGIWGKADPGPESEDSV